MRSQLAIAAALGACVLVGGAIAQEEEGTNPVVATVDGEEVRLGEVQAAAQNLPEQYREMPLAMLYEPLLDRVIDYRLLASEAEEQNLDQDSEVQEALERARAQVLRDALVQQRVEEGVSEERLRAAYEERKEAEDFAKEEVHARHILLPSQEEAEDVIAQLEEGADFAELAKEHSTGPSADAGGDLGYFSRDQMVPEFADAAFDLEAGEITEEPVNTQFGWHVIEVLDKRTTEPTFEETAPQLRQELAREVVSDLVTSLREEAEIERFAMDGSPLPEGEEAPAEGEEAPAMEGAEEPESETE